MNIVIRFIFGVFLSTIFTALALGIASFLFGEDGVVDFTGGFWGRFNFMVGAVYGTVTGFIAGVIIIGLNLNIVTGAIFGLLYNLFLGVMLVFLAGGGGWSGGITKIYYVSIIVGIINGVIVSLFSTHQQSLK